MLKREELFNPQSCLNKAEPEELIFVVRAKDPLAAQTVRHWAAMAVGVHEKEKIDEAISWAKRAEEFLETQSRPECSRD